MLIFVHSYCISLPLLFNPYYMLLGRYLFPYFPSFPFSGAGENTSPSHLLAFLNCSSWDDLKMQVKQDLQKELIKGIFTSTSSYRWAGKRFLGRFSSSEAEVTNFQLRTGQQQSLQVRLSEHYWPSFFLFSFAKYQLSILFSPVTYMTHKMK